MSPSSMHIQRAPLFHLLLPLMCGLCLAHVIILPHSPLFYILLALALASTSLFLPKMRLLLAGGALFLSGISVYQSNRNYLPEWELLPPREARLHIEVLRTFAPREKARSFNGIARITHSDPHLRDLNGQKIYFSLFSPPDRKLPIRTEWLSVIGVISPLPYHAPADGFDTYLINSGINFSFTRGRIVGKQEKASRYAVFCNRALGQLSDILGKGIEGKQVEATGIFRAMLLGQKHELGKDRKSLFLQSGTMHLFAISGLHIAAIALAIHTLLSLLQFPQIIRFALGALILWIYVSITGGAPSAVRAFIMVTLFQAAYTFRQSGNSLSALVSSAFLILLIQPLQFFSAGFQMSYGIVASLLLLGLPLGKLLKTRFRLFSQLPQATLGWQYRLFQSLWENLLDMIAIGLSTIPFSLICGILFFNLFTPGAFFANLIMIPLATITIFAGFLSMLSGLIGLSFLSEIFNHSGAFIIILMEKTLNFLSHVLPHQVVYYKEPWMGYMTLALILGSMIYGYSRHWAVNRGSFSPPFLCLIGSLLLGTVFQAG